MKKILFLIVCCFCFVCSISAKEVFLYDIKIGDNYSYGDKVDIFLGNSYGTTFPDQVLLFYVDKNGELLESFSVNNLWYLTWVGTEEYSRDMYLHAYFDFSFGKKCIDVYSDYVEYEEFGKLYDDACNDKFTLYSSGNDISKVKVWNVKDFNTFNEEKLIELCNDTRFNNSYICDNIDYFDYGHYIVLNEYNPATFKLVCEPKEVKIGGTTNCELVVNTIDEISEITVPVDNELFKILDYENTSGWELFDNNDGTITIKSEKGINGEYVVLGFTLSFKDDLKGIVNIVLEDISYVISAGYELNAGASDSINLYEEPVVEDENENVNNPITVDSVSILFVALLLSIFILLVIYRIRKILR